VDDLDLAQPFPKTEPLLPQDAAAASPLVESQPDPAAVGLGEVADDCHRHHRDTCSNDGLVSVRRVHVHIAAAREARHEEDRVLGVRGCAAGRSSGSGGRTSSQTSRSPTSGDRCIRPARASATSCRRRSARGEASCSPRTCELLLRQEREEHVRGDAEGHGPGHDHVVRDQNGEPMHPDSLSSGWRRRLRIARLPSVRFHDLRHAHATLMLQQGIHPKIVSERLGHASIGITLDIYSHVLPSMQAEAAEAVDAILGVA
jgi:hypothetical protein